MLVNKNSFVLYTYNFDHENFSESDRTEEIKVAIKTYNIMIQN